MKSCLNDEKLCAIITAKGKNNTTVNKIQHIN